MTTNNRDSTPLRPRLCHLRRWPDFPGYGFNLHCEKTKPGQYIGKVDENSPAESAGLRENDRIIEVNFAPIGNENHKQVVQRIKDGVMRNGTKYPEEVILLVLDPEADDYYKENSIVVTSSDSNVLKLETKSRATAKTNSSYVNEAIPNGSKEYHTNGSNRTYADTTPTRNTDVSTPSKRYDPNQTNPKYTNPNQTNPHQTNSNQTNPNYANPNYTNQNDQKSSWSPYSESGKDRRIDTAQASTSNGSGALFELHMSAAEYREKLKQQNAHKRDPRHKPMSMKEKHDFIDSL